MRCVGGDLRAVCLVRAIVNVLADGFVVLVDVGDDDDVRDVDVADE